MIHKDWKYADRILRNSFIKLKELDQCDGFTISKTGSLFVLSNMYMKSCHTAKLLGEICSPSTHSQFYQTESLSCLQTIYKRSSREF